MSELTGGEEVLSAGDVIRYDWDGTWYRGVVQSRNKVAGWYSILFIDGAAIVQLTAQTLGSKWFRLPADDGQAAEAKEEEAKEEEAKEEEAKEEDAAEDDYAGGAAGSGGVGTSSHYRGVSWKAQATAHDPKAGRWEARIMRGTKRQHLGYFAAETDAAVAYAHAAAEEESAGGDGADSVVHHLNHRGVTWSKRAGGRKTGGAWEVRITRNHKRQHIGYFDAHAEACAAYAAAAAAMLVLVGDGRTSASACSPAVKEAAGANARAVKEAAGAARRSEAKLAGSAATPTAMAAPATPAVPSFRRLIEEALGALGKVRDPPAALQHTTAHYSTLQHTTAHYSTL
jgi:hypothetical protein